ncbi:MAG: type II toxin-antitoxin system RelE/ParE family toxin, partial [Xanthomonadales bacterium]|nr:type II toxin-antitoxin system RelE/ParE family toxin [Xanthomonadales bacterium]
VTLYSVHDQELSFQRNRKNLEWNSFEALRGKRSGQHSIRINDQWRICFVWMDGDAENVEIVDYH